MTLYLTDTTTPFDIISAKASGRVHACKLYPAGATTNSELGVTALEKIFPTLQVREKISAIFYSSHYTAVELLHF